MNYAVTGGLGSGKSSVSKILASYIGCEVIDTDRVSNSQLLPGKDGLQQLEDLFGARFVKGKGELDRVALRNAVFHDPGVKRELEKILHPLVHKTIHQRMDSAELLGEHLVVEVPLLFEVDWQNDFDECIVTYIPELLVLERVVKRDKRSIGEVRSILDNQMSPEKKRTLSSFVIDNSDTFSSTVLQISHMAKQLAEKRA